MKDDSLYIIHNPESIERIESYTKSGRNEFMKNPMQQDAVIRNFEIIGEAVKRISEKSRVKSPKVPWRRIAGF